MKSAFAVIPVNFAVVPVGVVIIVAPVSPPIEPAAFVITESSLRFSTASAFVMTLGDASTLIFVP